MEKQVLWKPVKGFEGLYEISDLGDVKRVGKRGVMKKIDNGSGILRVCLCRNGVCKPYTIKSLLMLSFADELLEISRRIDSTLLKLVFGDLNKRAIDDASSRMKKHAKESKDSKGRKVLDSYSGFVYETLKHASASCGISYSTARYQISNNPDKSRFKYVS